MMKEEAGSQPMLAARLADHHEHADGTAVPAGSGNLHRWLTGQLFEQRSIHAAQLRVFAQDCCIGTMPKDDARPFQACFPVSMIIHPVEFFDR